MGGGGAGDANNNAGGAGGNGGGWVILKAGGGVTGSGSILANGNNGAITTGTNNDAPGGGGGGGFIAFSSGTPTRSVAVGANGTTSSASVTEFTPNGATAGAAGLLQTYTAVSSLFIPVSGTVFNDANGLTDATINGTATNLSNALYVSAVQSSVVIATTAVQSNGTHNFSALPPGTYNFVLHNNAAGQATAALPAGVVNTAEGSTAAGDGTINGIVISTSSCAAVSNLNYGINRRPVADNYNGSGWNLPPGNGLVNVPSAAFAGSDAEDGTCSNNLNGRTVTLNPAVGGTLYYFNGSLYVPITSATVINNFNNDNVYVDPTANSGPTVVNFSFLVRDDAGFDNAVPAQVNMTFSVLLPATGLSLSGSYANGKVQLQWQTLTEQQTKRFEIEMSNDGTNFQKIGELAAGGNSQSLRQYQFVTNKPAGQQWYCRVKLFDVDGSVSVSNVMMLNTTVNALEAVAVLPNPAAQYVWVSGLANAKQIVIASINGAALQQVNVTANRMQLNVSGLATGVYLLQISYENGSKSVHKLIKQ